MPDGAEETVTLLSCSSVSSSCPACGGTTTVNLFPLVSVPAARAEPGVLASWTVFT